MTRARVLAFLVVIAGILVIGYGLHRVLPPDRSYEGIPAPERGLCLTTIHYTMDDQRKPTMDSICSGRLQAEMPDEETYQLGVIRGDDFTVNIDYQPPADVFVVVMEIPEATPTISTLPEAGVGHDS